MPTHVAFLRAINLGGQRRAPRSELLAALEEGGFDEVDTFRASGNVVLSGHGGEKRIVRAIEEALAERLGFSVEVYLRSVAELRRLISETAAVMPGSGQLQVAFLRAAPDATARDQVLARATDHDLLAFGRRELLWLRRRPAGRSDLNLRAIERSVGPWTMRTMDTVSQIVARYFD
jgi:uncharacterized protein (DUF1697 family)